jgi:hypothetical protein
MRSSRLVLLLIPFLFIGCSNEHLSVHTEYIDEEYLASYHVKTPDPLLLNSPLGQQLIVQWNVPRDYILYEDLHLRIYIRFRDRQEIVQIVPMRQRLCCYRYELLNDAFCKTGGIITYKIEIIGDGSILDEWRHQLWTELIQVGS